MIRELSFFIKLGNKMYNLNELDDMKRIEVVIKKYIEAVKDPRQSDIDLENNLKWWIEGELEEQPSLVNRIANSMGLTLKRKGQSIEIVMASRLNEEEQDVMHKDAYHKTGHWGKKAAGVLPFSISTNRFLFGLRSPHVQEPNTWGIWGGAIDEGERPAKAALREFKEESGYKGKVLKVHPLSVYRDPESSFKYFSYIISIPEEFTPRLDWETSKALWTEYDRWPTPMHPKVKIMLANFKIDSILQSIVDDPR